MVRQAFRLAGLASYLSESDIAVPEFFVRQRLDAETRSRPFFVDDSRCPSDKKLSHVESLKSPLAASDQLELISKLRIGIDRL